MKYETPLDWKSELWWRKRPVEERIHHIHINPRIAHHGYSADKPNLPYLDNWQPGDSLLITGKTSTGKSTLAAEVVDWLVRNHEVSARWIDTDDYIEMLKDSFDDDGDLPEMYSTPHLIKYVKGVFDIVVVDGLGEERRTEFASHELGSLIRRRYDRMKSTIVTSTLGLPDIKARYGERLASPLADFALQVQR